MRGIFAPARSSERIMAVNQAQHSGLRRAGIPALLVVLALAAAHLHAQANPTSTVNPYFGSVTAQKATDEILKLSLDDAVALGLKNNLGLKQAENSEKSLQGQKLEALQNFLPTIALTGSNGVYQHNLAAMGFGPGTIAKFGGLFPGGKIPPGLS